MPAWTMHLRQAVWSLECSNSPREYSFTLYVWSRCLLLIIPSYFAVTDTLYTLNGLLSLLFPFPKTQIDARSAWLLNSK